MQDDVQDWLETPDQNFGWVVRGDESSLGSAKRFDSLENSIAAMRPRLIVDFTEPATTPWHNSEFPEDVDGDGLVAPLDALLIINELNTKGAGQLPPPSDNQPPPFLDVDKDDQLAPIDALLVINFLNTQAPAARPAPVAHSSPDSAPTAVTQVPSQIVAAIEAAFSDDETSRRSDKYGRSREN